MFCHSGRADGALRSGPLRFGSQGAPPSSEPVCAAGPYCFGWTIRSIDSTIPLRPAARSSVSLIWVCLK